MSHAQMIMMMIVKTLFQTRPGKTPVCHFASAGHVGQWRAEHG